MCYSKAQNCSHPAGLQSGPTVLVAIVLLVSVLVRLTGPGGLRRASIAHSPPHVRESLIWLAAVETVGIGSAVDSYAVHMAAASEGECGKGAHGG